MPVTNPDLWRTLPDLPEILARIKTGEYTLHGGVVRHAAGTDKAGQIIGHLKFPNDPQQAQDSIQKLQALTQEGFGSLQGGMDQLQQTMGVLQGLQTANLALSGLNLAVSVAGFMVVCNKLNGISAQIQAQSQDIAETLALVKEARERSLLAEEAEFRALLHSTQLFCEQGDVHHLKSLIPSFHKQYQFTKLVLEHHAALAASNVDRLHEITLLQDRLANLGLLLSHVQIRFQAPKHAQACLRDLAATLTDLNTKRVAALADDRDTAFRMPKSHLPNVISFLQRGKHMLPALAYEASLIELEITRPGAVLQAPESNEILLLAA